MNDLTGAFPGPSEMASRMRSFDWSTTPLGPPDTWPASLRVSLDICLASVSLKAEADSIELTVHDSGDGFDPDDAARTRGLGLTSMNERIKGVHGQLVVDSDPQSGTKIRARVPYAARA